MEMPWHGTEQALRPEGPRRRHFHPLAPIPASASPPAQPPSGVTTTIVTWADARSREWGMRETSHSEAPARVMAGGEAGDSCAASQLRVPGTDLLHRAPLLTTAGGGGGGAGPRSRCRYRAGVESGRGAAPLQRPPGPRVPSLRRGRRRSRRRRRRSPQAAPAILWQRGEQGRPSSGAEPVLLRAVTLALPAVFPCHLAAKCGIRQIILNQGVF
ncbi:uncharacterized protein LOC132330894 [Haemorhous mexicanus]|uniref:uncharacterized protein LOC132330894 n=1 Tax=Haemorhous mexicanus TaxID=30427 RepID=UPI0028BDB99D|nr:uncharacterized protein LOC132330894 [Haemorhous mexicanus]